MGQVVRANLPLEYQQTGMFGIVMCSGGNSYVNTTINCMRMHGHGKSTVCVSTIVVLYPFRTLVSNN